ncbi:MAG: hypothetical protein NTX22_02715 [Ignavibacteriales bacterium]|nr:hypothetical protein [Ignavibacteriales bacterium]
MSKSKNLAILLLSSSILFFVNGCFDSPKEPVFPNWDVELNIPITQRSYKLSEIIKPDKNPNLSIVDSTGSDSLYVFLASDLENTSPIANQIKVPVKLVPDDLDINGTGSGSNDLIYNADVNYRLDTAEFKSGSLYLALTNNSITTLTYELKVPGFKRKSDRSILKMQGNLNPGDKKLIEVLLSEYIYAQMKKGGFSNTDSTQKSDGILIRGKASSTGGGNVDFKTQVTNSEITLSHLVGKLKKIDLGFQKQEFNDVFGKQTQDFNSKIKFKGTRIGFEAKSIGSLRNLKILISSLRIAGYNKLPNGSYGAPYYLKILSNEFYSDSLVAGTTMKRFFDENNTNLLEFLQKFPELITVENKFLIDNENPNVGGSISDQDSIKIILDISAPIIISVSDAGFTDTTTVDISNNDREDIIKSNEAKLTVEMENHIALGVIAKCTFADKNYKPLFSIRNEAASGEIFEIPPSAVDNNGVSSQPSISKITCVLNDVEFQKLKDAEYIIFNVKLRSTGSTSTAFGPFVQVRAKDFIKFKVYGGVNYNLDPENLK